MIVYSHNYVTLRDVCKHNGLGLGEIMDAILNSQVSFGTNEDTLISQNTLQAILDNYFEDDVTLDWGRFDNTVLISLGS
jgi:hypothetical protein